MAKQKSDTNSYGKITDMNFIESVAVKACQKDSRKEIQNLSLIKLVKRKNRCLLLLVLSRIFRLHARYPVKNLQLMIEY